MKTKVLSLIESPRRTLIAKRLESANIDYSFFNAINLENSIIQITNLFDVPKFINIFGLKPSIPIISCTLSHKEIVLQHFKYSDETLLILEDDAIVATSPDELAKVCSNFENSNFDILLLGMSKIKKNDEIHFFYINPILKEVKISDNLYFGARFKLTSSGAVAYLVKKSAYEKIKNHSSLPWFVADEWKIISEVYNLKIASISRLLFYEDFENMNSHLNNEYIQSKSLFPYLPNKIKILLKFCYMELLLIYMRIIKFKDKVNSFFKPLL